MKKIFVFYHMFCVNDAQFRFERTYKKLKITGLLDICDKIFLVMVGKYRYEYSNQINDLIHDKRIQYIFSIIDTSEVSSINLIYEIASNEDCYILYLHSKGVTRPHLTPQMISWLDYMEYYLIEEHEKCLEVLKEYKTCGVNSNHYGGNFWWSNSDYVKKLKPLNINCWRFDCENWLFKDNSPEIDKSGFNLGYEFDYCWGFGERIIERKKYTNLLPIVEDYSITPFLNKSNIDISYAIFGNVDCKDIIERCVIDNKIYLRSDISLINYNNKNSVYVHAILDDYYLYIKINGEIIKTPGHKGLRNEDYLIYGY